MAASGLSLLGFMDADSAVAYLSSSCIVPDGGHPALVRIWQEAKARLGSPVSKAGRPRLEDIAGAYKPTLRRVTHNPRFDETVGDLKWSWKLVEIDPLLAFQFHVDIERAASLCVSLGGARTVRAMLPICLPETLGEPPPPRISAQENAIYISASSLNWRKLQAGNLGRDNNQRFVTGMAWGVGSPLLQVIRYEGRCYLRNGYHRAFGLRQAGLTEMPCLLLEATDFRQVVDRPQGFFQQELLESDDPPTLLHFSEDRAYPVALRRMARLLQVSWAEITVPIED